MVLKCPIRGSTSPNSNFSRVELREMLCRGNTDIETTGVNLNNWVFASAPADDLSLAGGVDGTLRAMLAVNHVTSTGGTSQRGNIVIGQVHAGNQNEPKPK